MIYNHSGPAVDFDPSPLYSTSQQDYQFFMTTSNNYKSDTRVNGGLGSLYPPVAMGDY